VDDFEGPLKIKEESELKKWDSFYQNDIYEVFIRDVIIVKTLPAKWLAIRRKDKTPIHNWKICKKLKIK